MADPIKLAEEIEARLRYDGRQYWPTLSPEDARTVAAALRLAEGMLEWGDSREPQTPDDVVRLGLAFAAYRAAREGR